jgi:hypothetical protein
MAEIVAALAGLRADAPGPFDVVAALAPGVDPAPYAAAGATWWVVDLPWEGASPDAVRAVIRTGPLT